MDPQIPKHCPQYGPGHADRSTVRFRRPGVASVFNLVRGRLMSARHLWMKLIFGLLFLQALLLDQTLLVVIVLLVLGQICILNSQQAGYSDLE